MAKMLVIVNPAAGRGKALKALPKIEAALKEMGLSHELARTEAPDHATVLAQEAAKAGYDIVACVGGDGTVSETGRGLIGTNTALALLPAGTGNDFARALGLHRKLDLAIRTLRDGNVQAIDVGRFGQHTFLNSVGVGFDGLVTRENQKVKSLTGILSYLVVVMKNLPTYKNPNFHLKGRDWEFKSKGVLVEFGNGQCAGGGFFDASRGFAGRPHRRDTPRRLRPLAALRGHAHGASQAHGDAQRRPVLQDRRFAALGRPPHLHPRGRQPQTHERACHRRDPPQGPEGPLPAENVKSPLPPFSKGGEDGGTSRDGGASCIASFFVAER